MVVLGQRAIIRTGDAAHEEVRIEAWGGADGKDVAVPGIHDHGGGAFRSEPRLDVVLQPPVDGQLHIRARIAFLPAQLAHDTPGRIDLDPPGAGGSAQLLLELRLDAELADLEARDLEKRIGVFELRQVIVADRTDIAQDMGEVGALRIDAAEPDLGRHARQGRRVDGDDAELLPGQAFGDRDRQGRAAPLDLAAGAVQILRRERDKLAQAVEHHLRIARILRRDGDAVILLVAGDHRAVTVEDQPAGRRQQADLDAVFLGKKLELVGLIDLEVAHAEGEHRHHRGLDAGDHQTPPSDAAHAFLGVLGRTSHIRRPNASMRPAVVRRNPNIHATATVTTG